MGCCGSKPQTASNSSNRSQYIQKQVVELKKEADRTVKLLLLGTGESGKSTVLKQIQILYSKEDGFSSKRLHFRTIIFKNVIESMQVLLEKREKFDILFQNMESFEPAQRLLSMSRDQEELLPSVATDVNCLWKDEGLRSVYKRRSEFQLIDNAAYFFDNVSKFSDPQFVPSNEDILRTRVRTSGLQKYEYEIDSRPWLITDVGGQKSERRKWIHCFTEATAVIFVVACSEFDQVMRENGRLNRMTDAMCCLDEVANAHLKNVPFIIFLNKVDLLEEKIKETPFPSLSFPEDYPSNQTVFPKISDGSDLKVVQEYIRSVFEAIPSGNGRLVYSTFTTAVDTHMMEKVMKTVRFILLENSFSNIGF